VQKAAIEEAIRIVQFVRNKALRLWMDMRGTNKNDLQCFCAVLAKEFPFARRLNSQARQAAASRAWFAIGRVRLGGNKKQQIATFPVTQIKRVRLVRRADGYYVQFGVQTERKIDHIPTGRRVGIDLGLKEFLTDSDGNTVANPRHLRKAEKRLKRLHRRLSRKQKKSANRRKARKVLAKGYLKVQRQREDFARKTANTLIRSSDLIREKRPGESSARYRRAVGNLFVLPGGRRKRLGRSVRYCGVRKDAGARRFVEPGTLASLDRGVSGITHASRRKRKR
jgi:transposase